MRLSGAQRMPTLHTDREYEQQLQQLRRDLLRMAERVEQMIANSVTALVEGDTGLARNTIENDHLVNRDEVEIDERCLQILARRQPMASDLRFITLALKMVTDLERIGDLAVNICERAVDLANLPPLAPWDKVPRMAEIVRSMVRDALNAFVTSDALMAQQVIERDDEVDGLYMEFCLNILPLMAQSADYVERGVHIQSVAKVLERMADHATNLAEQVVFMVKGKDIRHIGKLPAG